MKNCLCQGNKSMREMEHMRSILSISLHCRIMVVSYR